MIYGRLDLEGTYAPLLGQPVWLEAFRWLKAMPPDLAPGIYHLCGDEMFVNVHGYETKARESCRYESHRRYIDLQYCIRGAELLEWHPITALVPIDAYDHVKDVIHYSPPAKPDAQVRLSPGSFAIFFAEDGHMPKVRAEPERTVDKLVFKIDGKLLARAAAPTVG